MAALTSDAMLDAITSSRYPLGMVKSLTDQLREAVKTCGVSRYRLAKDLKIDQAALSRFVHGERGLSLEAIDRLAAHLGLRLTADTRRRKTP